MRSVTPVARHDAGREGITVIGPLSPAFEATYDRLLCDMSRHADALPGEVCLHWPMHEPAYTGRLLVVGQALNGWGHMCAPADFADAGVRAQQLAATRRSSERDGAFGWMRRQRWSRPFWKLARVAMDEMDLRLDQIAWSNLAKLSPAEGKNPWGELLWRQHRFGGEMLRTEVAELDPEIVLIVSGRGYAEPFLSGAGLTPGWSRRGALQFDGLLGARRWVIVSHPGTFARRYEASRAALLEALQRTRPDEDGPHLTSARGVIRPSSGDLLAPGGEDDRDQQDASCGSSGEGDGNSE